MSKKSAIVAAVIAAIVAIGVVLAAFQPWVVVPPENSADGGTIIANGTEPAPKEIVSIASERSAFPFVQRWASEYNNDENALATVEVSYYLDKPPTPSDLMIVGDIRQATTELNYVPVSAQAVVVVYNIPSFPDIPAGMKLNASVLSSIFNGTITKWNDPAIKSLNSDLNLPSERIIVVHENNNSSSLTILEKYISDGIHWPKNGVSALGQDELAATIRKTPYSIGYVDFSFATQTRMTFAAIGNPDGGYVLPSMDSIGQALNSSIQVQNVSNINQTAAFTPPFLNASMLTNGSYPLTALYYASFPANTSNETRNATLDFVRWVIDKDRGQQTLSEVQYPSIYQENGALTTYAGIIINSTAPRASKT